MKIRYYVLAAIVAAVPVAAIAHDSDGDRGGHHRHHRGDHGRGDGPGRALLDKDGNLTLDAVKTAQAARFKALDTNGDGAISPDEMSAKALERFAAADANKDGTVTKDERKTARKEARAKWKEAHPDHNGDDAKPAEVPAAPAPTTPPN
ncbi:hypothetical protein sos41_14260 [Alphaproteobacteria bacterium SO-S41]|nr:hypothetical protein sos41_14260 [Alphaproteobacteria bacterium SO-S41]